jgi:hypothetical protein
MIVDFLSYRISVSVTSFRVSNLSATVARSYWPNIEKAQITLGHSTVLEESRQSKSGLLLPRLSPAPPGEPSPPTPQAAPPQRNVYSHASRSRLSGAAGSLDVSGAAIGREKNSWGLRRIREVPGVGEKPRRKRRHHGGSRSVR